VKAEQAPAPLGTQIAARFEGVGLREGEEIRVLRGFSIKNPFGA